MVDLDYIVDELNKYDCEAFLDTDGAVHFKNSPSLSLSTDGSSYIVSSLDEKNSSFIQASYTQPLKAVYYILKGLWK